MLKIPWHCFGHSSRATSMYRGQYRNRGFEIFIYIYLFAIKKSSWTSTVIKKT